MAHFLLAPVNVQGSEAAPGIVDAIRRLDASGKADVIIVARGGGSREDLWVFNDERIARAAYACQTPLVSAIGHEIDFSILDFVADLRAPTPSAAAELVMPDMRAEWENLYKIYTNIRQEMHQKIHLCYNRLDSAVQAPAFSAVRLLPEQKRTSLIEKKSVLHQHVSSLQKQRRQKLAHWAELCHSLNPYSVLARGYAVVEKQGEMIKDSQKLNKGDKLHIRLEKGSTDCIVEQVYSDEVCS